MADLVQMIGKTFARLTVTGEAEKYVTPKGQKKRRVFVRCNCGNELTVVLDSLTRGITASCGCYRKELLVAPRKHGYTRNARKEARPSEYATWFNMIQRCENPKNKAYPYYGGRGISVCKEWRESFSAFLNDMGRKASPDLSIDRIEVNGNYEFGNCRWATKIEQARNKRPRTRKKTSNA